MIESEGGRERSADEERRAEKEGLEGGEKGREGGRESYGIYGSIRAAALKPGVSNCLLHLCPAAVLYS